MSENIDAPSLLSLFETEKPERVSFARNLVEMLKDGTGDPLRVLKQLKAMNEIIDMLTDKSGKNKEAALAKEFYKLVEAEFDKHGGKTVELFGASFQKKEGGVKYDYSKCGYPAMEKWRKTHLEYEQQVKEFEKFLRTVPESGMQILDDETGELVTVYPPSKISTTTIACTLK